MDSLSHVQPALGRIASDSPVEKLWREARALTIYEGSSEIQLLNVFREMRRLAMTEEGL